MIDPFATDQAVLGEPLSLVIGYSAQWRREVNIDATLFSLRYDLRPYSPSDADLDYSIPMAHVGGVVFAADIGPADIAGWNAGRYFWDLIVVRTSDDRSKVIETGEFNIFSDISDRRSHAEIMLGKIESILQGRADNDVESYTIKSRSITKMSASDLRDWRDYYVREIENRPREKGLFVSDPPKRNTLRVRFRD